MSSRRGTTLDHSTQGTKQHVHWILYSALRLSQLTRALSSWRSGNGREWEIRGGDDLLSLIPGRQRVHEIIVQLNPGTRQESSAI